MQGGHPAEEDDTDDSSQDTTTAVCENESSLVYADSEIRTSGSKKERSGADGIVSLDDFHLFDVEKTSSLLIYGYFGLYILVGCVLFANYLPWT